MTTSNDSMQLMEYYLGRLRHSIAGFPPAERDEIVAEIRSHITERSLIDGVVDPRRVRETLEALGRPEEIASQYQTDALLARAAGSRSPWLLLRATLRWAMLGAKGFGIFMIAVTGYVMAAAFFLCAILKPFFPENIGLWMGPATGLSMGFHAARDPQAWELLGHWLPPVAMLLGLLAILGTTHAIRALIRRSGRAKLRWRADPRN
ncbi:MAG: hypothetical protein ABSH05_05165 [Bryobacteraceae bacterium]|jgi:uncharacterized membrane protein